MYSETDANPRASSKYLGLATCYCFGSFTSLETDEGRWKERKVMRPIQDNDCHCKLSFELKMSTTTRGYLRKSSSGFPYCAYNLNTLQGNGPKYEWMDTESDTICLSCRQQWIPDLAPRRWVSFDFSIFLPRNWLRPCKRIDMEISVSHIYLHAGVPTYITPGTLVNCVASQQASYGMHWIINLTGCV